MVGLSGSAFQQSTRPVHPALTDVEIPAGEPGQRDVDRLHRRRRGIATGKLLEHLLGISNRFFALTESPCGGCEGVEIVGGQGCSLIRPSKRLVAGQPIPPEVSGPRGQQKSGMTVKLRFHPDHNGRPSEHRDGLIGLLPRDVVVVDRI